MLSIIENSALNFLTETFRCLFEPCFAIVLLKCLAKKLSLTSHCVLFFLHLDVIWLPCWSRWCLRVKIREWLVSLAAATLFPERSELARTKLPSTTFKNQAGWCETWDCGDLQTTGSKFLNPNGMRFPNTQSFYEVLSLKLCNQQSKGHNMPPFCPKRRNQQKGNSKVHKCGKKSLFVTCKTQWQTQNHFSKSKENFQMNFRIVPITFISQVL